MLVIGYNLLPTLKMVCMHPYFRCTTQNKYVAPVTGASSALRRWQVGLDWTSRIFETVEGVIALDQRLSKI